MIHLLAWTAVVLTATHSYDNRRHLDPHGVLEHRAGLPAIGFALILLFALALLVHSTGAASPLPPLAPPISPSPWAGIPLYGPLT